APGMILMTGDGWTADHTKQGYLSMTAHWINVDPDTGKWTLRAEVVGFCLIHGTHDNTSSNTMLCETIESQHALDLCCKLTWYRCLEHIVNLAMIDVMSYISESFFTTKKNSDAMGDFD
ncbi:hypothetical protein L208DRAFT_1015113, partial [Tricholoma matsutake]